jgi:hypothetical protein
MPNQTGYQQIFLAPGKSIDAGWNCVDFGVIINAVALAYALPDAALGQYITIGPAHTLVTQTRPEGEAPDSPHYAVRWTVKNETTVGSWIYVTYYILSQDTLPTYP